jgi:hypothetical protein
VHWGFPVHTAISHFESDRSGHVEVLKLQQASPSSASMRKQSLKICKG